MVYKLYSVKDSLSGKFYEILPFDNDEMALRYFKNLASESKIKNDLQFFCLGFYNITTGEITSEIEFLISGADINE